MSLATDTAQRTQASLDAPSQRPLTWTAVFILVTFLACMIAASVAVGTPVLDVSLVGP